MSNSGAKAALKGYRLQTLYILYRILSSKDPEITFQPEGNEDLAIYKNDQLIESIQIKAYSSSLSLSDFIEPNKQDTFIHRSIQLLIDSPSSQVRVISFGDIGVELKSAWDSSCLNHIHNQTKIRGKLTGFDLPNDQINLIFNHLKWQNVEEDELVIEVFKLLKQTLLSGDVENAFSLLTIWLYSASEKRSNITQKDLLEKINVIGKYFSEREAHQKEWFTSIIPLTKNSLDLPLEQLEKEYYYGISTRFSHIQANLDVVRREFLDRINDSFKSSQTVIIHGASGQGKTALAYRYLQSYAPEICCFEIRYIENREHAQLIALALADYLHVFNATVYLYIDVNPKDNEWASLVCSLLERSNIKILISIREEDLARQDISNEQLGFPQLIALSFAKEDAKAIYNELVKKGVVRSYATFEHAWLNFNEKGSLLEFVYFLTQTDSLVAKLKSQIKRLNADVREGKLSSNAIKFLTISTIATAYQVRFDIKSLVNAINLEDASSIFELFEEEYLIRRSQDHSYIEALHPIRSKILSDILIDPLFFPWIDAVKILLPHIVEDDLETFLFYAFLNHRSELQEIFDYTSKINITKWSTVAGVNRALLWLGISGHLYKNQNIIDKAMSFTKTSGCPLSLWLDLGDVSRKDSIENIIDNLSKNNAISLKFIKEIRLEMSDKSNIYIYAQKWLLKFNYSYLERPKFSKDWSGFGEVLLWLSKLDIAEVLNDLSWVLDIKVKESFQDIEPLSDVTQGLFYFSRTVYDQFIQENLEVICEIFQRKTETVWLEKFNNTLCVHYIIPYTGLQEEVEIGNYLNRMSVNRIMLLQKIFPSYDVHSAQGYGHQYLYNIIPSFHDDSSKNIPIENSVIAQFVKVNSIWRNFIEYDGRPNDWGEYANNILLAREKILDGVNEFIKILIRYFKGQQPQVLELDKVLFDELTKVNKMIGLLPKTAADPWGMTSETMHQSLNEQNSMQNMMQNDSKDFRKACSEYFISFINFIRPSSQVLLLNGILGRAPNDVDHDLKDLYLSSSNLHTTLRNLKTFQYEYKKLFNEIVDHKTLSVLEAKELKQFKTLWALWYQFAYYPKSYWKTSPEVMVLSKIKTLEQDLISSVKEAIKNITEFDVSILLNEDISNKFKIFHTKCNSLYIEVALNDLEELQNALIITINALSNVIRPLEFQHLKYYMLSDLWEKIVIIPTNNNKYIFDSAWSFLLSEFVGTSDVISESNKNLLPIGTLRNSSHEVTDGIEKLVLILKEEIRLLGGLVYHLSSLESLLNNADDNYHIDILDNYCRSVNSQAIQHINVARNTIDRIIPLIENGDELFYILDECKLAILYDEIDVYINLSECSDQIILINHALLLIEGWRLK